MMQIKELIIYGLNGKIRKIPFNLGSVNIITGKSKSGKSAVGDIIDYCLGGGSCHIADGVVRECSDWYALLLQFETEQLFVARKNPTLKQQSTSQCYVQIEKEIMIPETCDFIPNQNVDGLEELLSRRIGISENLNTPPENQSRNPLSANIRHALYYCFQKQNEIASPNILFHRQQEEFITQAIKDTMPYFLGILNEESLKLEHEKVSLKRKLAIEKRQLKENMALIGGGLERAISLISEAKEIGLLSQSLVIDYDNYEVVKETLNNAVKWKPDDEIHSDTIDVDRLTQLQLELSDYESKLENLNIEIDNTKNFTGVSSGYENAVKHQVIRLNSIGLFEQLDFSPNHCPFCSSDLTDNAIPNIDSIKTAINNLNKDIENIKREHPKISKYIENLEDNRQKFREKIHTLKAEIKGIYGKNERMQEYRDSTARLAKVVGRISLWLDSVNTSDNLSGKQKTIEQIQNQIEEIERLLSKDEIIERQTSILNRIAVDMSLWAKELNLEHGDNPYRLDMGKVTVMVDKPERPIPLRQLGSGSNWVGVHLITYLSIHKYFIDAKRPIPRFLFIDQPSQVYFPSEREGQGQDWDMIHQLYKFIFDKVSNLNGQLQLIIVDHANLTEESFRKAITEDWHSDKNLIPTDWYSTVE